MEEIYVLQAYKPNGEPIKFSVTTMIASNESSKVDMLAKRLNERGNNDWTYNVERYVLM